MMRLLWWCIFIGLLAVELPLAIYMLWIGWHNQPCAFACGLIFYFPIRDSIKALHAHYKS